MIFASGGPVTRIGGMLLGLSLFTALPITVVSPKGVAPVFIVAVLAALLSLKIDGIRRLLASHHLRKAVGIALLIFVGYGMLSALWSVDPARSLKVSATVGGVIMGGIILLAAIRRYEPVDRHFLRRACLAGFGLTAALLLFEYLSGADLNRLIRFGSTNRSLLLADMNFIKPSISLLGVFLFPLAAIALSGGRQLLAAAITMISLAGIVLVSVSSAAVAAAGGLLATGLYLMFRQSALRAAAAFTCLIAVVMPVAPGLFDPVPTHYAAELSIPNSAMHRFRTWQFTADRISEKPVLGWGMDSSRHVPGGNEEIPVYVELSDGSEVNFVEQLMPLHPHNWFLQIWLELGGVGMLMITIILMLLLQWIGSVGRSRAQTALLFGQAVAIIGTASLSFGAWQNWWLGAIFMSFAYAATVEHDGGGRSAV